MPVAVFLFHLFDGDYFVGLGVDCLVDGSEGSVSEDGYYLIFLHFDLTRRISKIKLTLISLKQ